MSSDYQINWLRTKARFNRYNEELCTVKDEMCWTLLYFETQRSTWTDRASRSENHLGHKAYALKQAAMWEKFGIEGNKAFKKLI
jgi:hypothetical protein